MSGRPDRLTAAATKLHSEGAEFLVVGHLLIRGVHATKAYVQFPGWDVLATDTATGRSCRVQVKARAATDFDGGFPISNFDADFIVLVALNRGYRYSRPRGDAGGGERDPEYWVLPMAVVRSSAEGDPRMWGKSFKVYLSSIDRVEQYHNAWGLIGEALRAG